MLIWLIGIFLIQLFFFRAQNLNQPQQSEETISRRNPRCFFTDCHNYSTCEYRWGGAQRCEEFRRRYAIYEKERQQKLYEEQLKLPSPTPLFNKNENGTVVSTSIIIFSLFITLPVSILAWTSTNEYGDTPVFLAILFTTLTLISTGKIVERIVKRVRHFRKGPRKILKSTTDTSLYTSIKDQIQTYS